MSAILPEYAGYVVVLAFGAIFACLTTGISYLENRFVSQGKKVTSEDFNTAGRSVGTGLIAAVIVSQWTWAATLLQSSTVAHKYGISGPFWYAAGASVQVLLFSYMAIQIKLKAPNAHTFCEIIRVRFGYSAHKLFLCFGLATNVIVTAMLLLGGSAVVSDLTGMNVGAAAFLMPIGVIVYTMHGGLKASFIAAYLHTAVIYVMLLVFAFVVYGNSSPSAQIGSPRQMWLLLDAVSAAQPVEGNAQGSYLTMSSSGGIIFGVINIIGNFGTIFVDQGYWQSAIASQPASSVKGFLVGGLSWFAIPFTLATSIGLASVALGIQLTEEEVEKGLVVPTTIAAFMGQPGAVAVLTMLFMAVTSSGSAEMIAVSSLLTYDVYMTYVEPNATGQRILWISRAGVVGFGLLMGALALLLLAMDLSLGFVYLAMGVFIGSAVVPVAITITWPGAAKIPVMTGAVVGLMLGVLAWLGAARSITDGPLSMDSVSNETALLVGNCVSLGSGAFISVGGSLVFPPIQPYSFDDTRAMKLVRDSQHEFAEDEQLTDPPNETSYQSPGSRSVEKASTVDGAQNGASTPTTTTNLFMPAMGGVENGTTLPSPLGAQQLPLIELNEFDSVGDLQRSLRFSVRAGLVITLCICFIWPMPLFFSQYVFSVDFFSFWVVLSIIWALLAAATIIGLPLVQARHAFVLVFRGLATQAQSVARRRLYSPPEFGSFSSFVVGFASGLLLPYLSPIAVYLLDPTNLPLIGAALGSSCTSIAIGSILLAYGFQSSGIPLVLVGVCSVIGAGCTLYVTFSASRKRVDPPVSVSESAVS